MTGRAFGASNTSSSVVGIELEPNRGGGGGWFATARTTRVEEGGVEFGCVAFHRSLDLVSASRLDLGEVADLVAE